MNPHLSACEPSATTGLSIKVARAGDRGCTVVLSGEIDIVSADGLYQALTAAMHRYGPSVALDAAAVRFCDARGLGALVRAANHARVRGGGVTVVAASPQLSKLISVTGLARRFAPAPPPTDRHCHHESWGEGVRSLADSIHLGRPHGDGTPGLHTLGRTGPRVSSAGGGGGGGGGGRGR